MKKNLPKERIDNRSTQQVNNLAPLIERLNLLTSTDDLTNPEKDLSNEGWHLRANPDSQLGHSDKAFIQDFVGQGILQVVTKHHPTFVHTKQGLYSFEANARDQLEHGDSENKYKPTKNIYVINPAITEKELEDKLDDDEFLTLKKEVDEQLGILIKADNNAVEEESKPGRKYSL